MGSSNRIPREKWATAPCAAVPFLVQFEGDREKTVEALRAARAKAQERGSGVQAFDHALRVLG